MYGLNPPFPSFSGFIEGVRQHRIRARIQPEAAQGALARLARVHVKADKEGSESSGFDTGLKGLNPFPHPVLFIGR